MEKGGCRVGLPRTRHKAAEFGLGGLQIRVGPAEMAPRFRRRHTLSLRVLPAVNGSSWTYLDYHNLETAAGVSGMGFLQEDRVLRTDELAVVELVIGEFLGEKFHGYLKATEAKAGKGIRLAYLLSKQGWRQTGGRTSSNCRALTIAIMHNGAGSSVTVRRGAFQERPQTVFHGARSFWQSLPAATSLHRRPPVVR